MMFFENVLLGKQYDFDAQDLRYKVLSNEEDA